MFGVRDFDFLADFPSINFQLFAKNQATNTRAVEGIVKVQYIQNLSCTTSGLSYCKDGNAKRAAKKVTGKKAMVMIAIVFIAELSFFIASARSLFTFARDILVTASSCVIRPNTLPTLDESMP